MDPAYPESPDPEEFATDPDSRLFTTLAAASGGGIRAFGAATEASYFSANGPTVVFGPGALSDDYGPVAHAEREYVAWAEIQEATRVIRETIETLL